MVAVFIHNAETGERKYVCLAPASMDRVTAQITVDAAIEKCKENDEYQFEDLEELLTEQGFVWPETICAKEVM